MKQIDISTKKHPNTFAIVDDDEYEKLIRYKWHMDGDGYAARSVRWRGGCVSVKMHSEIFQPPKGMLTDHQDTHKLNNRKSNLRACTNSQNQFNRGKQANNISGYKGVSWHKASKKWHVQIRSDPKVINLGLFTCIVRAAKVYDEAAKKYHGEFAQTNF